MSTHKRASLSEINVHNASIASNIGREGELKEISYKVIIFDSGQKSRQTQVSV